MEKWEVTRQSCLGHLLCWGCEIFLTKRLVVKMFLSTFSGDCSCPAFSLKMEANEKRRYILNSGLSHLLHLFICRLPSCSLMWAQRRWPSFSLSSSPGFFTLGESLHLQKVLSYKYLHRASKRLRDEIEEVWDLLRYSDLRSTCSPSSSSTTSFSVLTESASSLFSRQEW